MLVIQSQMILNSLGERASSLTSSLVMPCLLHLNFPACLPSNMYRCRSQQRPQCAKSVRCTKLHPAWLTSSGSCQMKTMSKSSQSSGQELQCCGSPCSKVVTFRYLQDIMCVPFLRSATDKAPLKLFGIVLATGHLQLLVKEDKIWRGSSRGCTKRKDPGGLSRRLMCLII